MQTFSAIWTAGLKAAILKAAPPSYRLTIRNEEEQAIVRHAVNGGIDAHLEACYVPARGDSFQWVDGQLKGRVSPESLPVLVRRVMNDCSDSDGGLRLACDICYTLGIELI